MVINFGRTRFFNREEKASYNIQVRALGEGSITRNFTIEITNVNDAPVIAITNDQIPFAEGTNPVLVLEGITIKDEDKSGNGESYYFLH